MIDPGELRRELKLLEQQLLEQLGHVAGDHPVLSQPGRELCGAACGAEEAAGMLNGVGADIAEQVAGVIEKRAFRGHVGGKHHRENRDELQPGKADCQQCSQ